MARYRKVDVRLWGDIRFRQLSAPPPNAQSLWVYLLTGPHTANIPGLSCTGEAALAEALGWPLPAFRKAFREVAAQGMAKADWSARVVWVPHAIRYNQPESPNVVKGWRSTWDEIPECELKAEARRVLGMEIPKGKSFREAFEQALPEGFREGLPEGGLFTEDVANSDPSANQEQEQEQEPLSPAKPAEKASNPKEKKPRPRDELFDAVAEVSGSDPRTSGSYVGKVCRLLREAEPPYTPAEVRALPNVIRKCGWSIPITLAVVEKYIGWTRRAPSRDMGGAPPEGDEERQQRVRADRAARDAKYGIVQAGEAGSGAGGGVS